MQLNDKLHYLNQSGNRFFLDTRPNLRRTMEDRKKSISANDVSTFIRNILQRQLNPPSFNGIHVFTPHRDVPNDTSLRLVVLPDDATYFTETKEADKSKTLATEYLKQRGDQPRLYANRLIFLAADQDAANNMRNLVRTAIAWDSLVSDANDARLNLDQYQLKQARDSLNSSQESAKHSIVDAYRWLLVPTQTASSGSVGDITLDSRLLSSTQSVSNEIERVLKEHEDVITRWAPIHLGNTLKMWYLKDNKYVSAKSVWEDFCKYPYLPRLSDVSVLENTLAQSSADTFGLAYGFEDGRFIEPHLGDGFAVTLDSSLLLVDATSVQEQLKQELNPETTVDTQVTTVPAEPEVTSGTNTASKRPKKFFGRIQFENSASAPTKFKEIFDEVVSQLSREANSNVIISIDIDAQSPSGFDENIQRAVRENSKVLGISDNTFED